VGGAFGVAWRLGQSWWAAHSAWLGGWAKLVGRRIRRGFGGGKLVGRRFRVALSAGWLVGRRIGVAGGGQEH
jgi:hypothetical protein